MSADLKEVVQDKYGEAARRVRTGEGLPADCCSKTSCCEGVAFVMRSHCVGPPRRSAKERSAGKGHSSLAWLRQSDRPR